jgi:hypothetical protein
MYSIFDGLSPVNIDTNNTLQNSIFTTEAQRAQSEVFLFVGRRFAGTGRGTDKQKELPFMQNMDSILSERFFGASIIRMLKAHLPQAANRPAVSNLKRGRLLTYLFSSKNQDDFLCSV